MLIAEYSVWRQHPGDGVRKCSMTLEDSSLHRLFPCSVFCLSWTKQHCYAIPSTMQFISKVTYLFLFFSPVPSSRIFLPWCPISSQTYSNWSGWLWTSNSEMVIFFFEIADFRYFVLGKKQLIHTTFIYFTFTVKRRSRLDVMNELLFPFMKIHWITHIKESSIEKSYVEFSNPGLLDPTM